MNTTSNVDNGKLANMNAIVTGGSSGIGSAIVKSFVKEGANVVFCYVGNDDDAKQTIKNAEFLGRKPFAMECDVSNPESVKNFVKFAEQKIGPIDILVNNAGISISNSFENISIEEFDKIIGVHLRGTFLMCKQVYVGMKTRKFGKIINITSQLAFKGGVDLSHYCAAKAGISGFTKALAMEAAPFGINVNSIAPGPVETTILGVLSEEWRENKLAELPIGRFGKVEEISPAAVYLSSRESDYMIGATLHINGGDVMI